MVVLKIFRKPSWVIAALTGAPAAESGWTVRRKQPVWAYFQITRDGAGEDTPAPKTGAENAGDRETSL